jgi:hypothetical protein
MSVLIYQRRTWQTIFFEQDRTNVLLNETAEICRPKMQPGDNTMSNRSKTVISLTLVGLFIFAGQAGASNIADSGLEDEVNSCIAEVRDRLDYSDATGVRHYVTAIKRRIVGYTMNIDTAVYGKAEGETIRAYATTCVVNGNHKPLRFDIVETS